MSHKLNYFKNKETAEYLHSYLIDLPRVISDDSAKALSIGYYVEGQRYKFATLIAASYESLVLHVDPGTRNTELGKEIQKKVQSILCFDISESRNHVLKENEVYIPLEHINTLEKITEFIKYAYHKQVIKTKNY